MVQGHDVLQEKPRRARNRSSGAVLRFGDDPDLMWKDLEDHLAYTYGIDGIFYLIFPVGDPAVSLDKLFERAVCKVTYPQAYIDSVDDNPLADDRPAEIVLETGEACFWHHESTWTGASPMQLLQRSRDIEHGMGVGVCLPIKTANGRVCGGFGLRHGEQDRDSFDRLMDGRLDALTAELVEFDRRFRGPFARQTYGLSLQETTALSRIASGMTVAQAAFQTQLSPKTVEAYLASIRKKTHSATTAEAAAKAVFFQII